MTPLPKLREVGEITTDAIPLAESATVCGLLLALVVMVSTPAGCAPNVEGVTVRAMLQVAPAASAPAHVVEGSTAYGVPEFIVTEEIVRLVDWLLVSLTVKSVLVVPSTTLPKFTAVGESAVGAMPVPVSATVRGLFDALVVIVSEPAGTAPKAVGVRVTEMLQVEFPARVLPQVVEA